jgi:O-antigen/teichoic acid export membrane protein
MLRNFVKNSAIYSMSGLLARGISLFLVPFYTRVFAPDDYGIIDLLNIFITMAALVLPLQITQAVARFYGDAESSSQAVAISSSALLFTLGVFSAFLLLVQAFPAGLSSMIFGGPGNATVMRVVGVALFFSGIFYFAQNQLKWMQKAAEHAIVNILYSLVTIGVTVIFVLVLRFGVIGVFVGQVCGGITGSAFSLYFGRESYRAVFDRCLLFQMIRFSLPLVPAAFFVYFLGIISRLSIKQFMTLGDLGLFAIGFRISSLALLIMAGITSSILPMIYSNYREKNTPEFVEKAFRLTLLVALTVTVCVSVFSREILIILTTPVYYDAGEVVPFLVAAAFISGFYVFVPGLHLNKETRLIAWIHGAAVIVSIVLNIVLIRAMGIVGAAIASMLSAIFLFVVILWYSQKRYYIPYAWHRYLSAAFIAGLMISMSSWIKADGIFAFISLKVLLIAGTLSVLCFNLTTGIERRAYAGLVRRFVETRRGSGGPDDGPDPAG